MGKVKKVLSAFVIAVLFLSTLQMEVNASDLSTPVKVDSYEEFKNEVSNGNVAPEKSFYVYGQEWKKIVQFEVLEEGNVYIDARSKAEGNNYIEFLMKLFNNSHSEIYFSELGYGTKYANKVGCAHLKKGIYSLELEPSKTAAEQHISIYICMTKPDINPISVKYNKSISEDGKTINIKIDYVHRIQEVSLYMSDRKCDIDIYSEGKRYFLDKNNCVTITIPSKKDGYLYIGVVGEQYGMREKKCVQILNKYTADISGIEDKIYTGKEIKQDNITVKAGKDKASYTIKYKDNTKVGKAKMTIVGTGDTIGSVTKTFNIVSKNTVIPKLTLYKSGSKTIKGKAANNAIITVTVGNKTYKTKANSKGDFKVLLKTPLKVNTKIKVKAYKNNKSLYCEKTVKNRTISSPKLKRINVNDKYVSGRAVKNRTIKVVINSKVYKTRSNYKGDFVVKVPRLKKGTVLKVRAYDKYGNYSKLISQKVK